MDGPTGPAAVEIIDVVDAGAVRRLPPCADPRFDHRSCDYWEDHVRGSKATRASWWQEATAAAPSAPQTRFAGNPFAPASPEWTSNPFAPAASTSPSGDPFAPDSAMDDVVNPFAPPPPSLVGPAPDAPRKLQLLSRGQRVFGSYAKLLLLDGQPAGYTQFGPLSAYPRARHIRELYPALPDSPLPAVITCIATTAQARGSGLARTLVLAVCDDLASRGFAAIETYPDLTLSADEASAAHPAFWETCGFGMAVADERYPVMRLSLA